MNWELFSAIAGVNIAVAGIIVGLMLWVFGKLDSDMKQDRQESNAKIQGLAQAIHEEMSEFHKEQKDFHGRMCRLEEKYQQINNKGR